MRCKVRDTCQIKRETSGPLVLLLVLSSAVVSNPAVCIRRDLMNFELAEVEHRLCTPEFSKGSFHGSLPSNGSLSDEEESFMHEESFVDTFSDDKGPDRFHCFHPPRISVSVQGPDGHAPGKIISPVGGRPRSHRVTHEDTQAASRQPLDPVTEVLQIEHLRRSRPLKSTGYQLLMLLLNLSITWVQGHPDKIRVIECSHRKC